MSEDKKRNELIRELDNARARVNELESRLFLKGATNPGVPKDQYRTLFEKSADAILIIDGETFVDCNQAAVEMLHAENKQQVLETHPSELSPPVQPDGRDSFEKANEMIANAFEKGSHRFEWDHKRADGEVFPVEVLLTAVPEGDRPKLHVVWRDITERKQLEAQLRQSQKLEAIGKLTGGIAHDFNNLLVAINGNAELLQDAVKDDAELMDVARQLRWAGERAAELTRQLLTFSRKQVLQPTVLDLNAVITRFHKLLGRLIGEDVQLVLRTAPTTVKLKADPGQIEQVIINLVTNARDAMPDGGCLTIEAEARVVRKKVATGNLKLEPGDYVRLAVTDTGTGMSEETQRQAFDPFYTTKGLGEGTGLGLATVYGIVRQSGGDVLITSDLGKGTTVEAWFPATFEVPSEESVNSVEVTGGNETILVAEDETAVSNLVDRLLRREGYNVVLAQNGEEALEQYETRANDIDLILSDVVMPRMGGPELIKRLRERGHNPVVIFASGYTDNTLGPVEQLGEDTDFIQKPYSPRELLKSIRTALDRKLANSR